MFDRLKFVAPSFALRVLSVRRTKMMHPQEAWQGASRQPPDLQVECAGAC